MRLQPLNELSRVTRCSLVFACLVGCVGLAPGLAMGQAEAVGSQRAGDSPSGPVAGSVLRGQALYQERCAGCHRVDAHDAGPCTVACWAGAPARCLALTTRPPCAPAAWYGRARPW